MKKSLVLLVPLLMVSTIHAQNKIKGNGNETTITRSTADYEAVSFAGPFDYVLVAGTEGEIVLEGEENLLEHIITEVKNGTLVVKTDNKVNLQTTRNNTIKITVPFKDLNAVALAGSGNLWTEHKISGKNLKVSLAGSGDAKLDVAATNTKVNVAGSGELELTGKTIKLEVDLAGSGEFKGFHLETDDADVTVAGSGSIDLVCHGHLKARVTGSGDIRYNGNPKTEDTKVTGSGSISN
ncbi:head GIN domain-containing protein [uncultured Gelidibacter sp.]|uniref:head GIN domain-containing protein n=1 Tax=uncultured Gelidibacter sp. TaxID=259318 RepID=UPI0026387A6E|nr:head GIN domain-containing protein [uncultured Gelidibacter sp.]